MEVGAPKNSRPIVHSLCDLKAAKERLSGLSLVTCLKTAISESREEAERRRSGVGAEKETKNEIVEINLSVSEKMSCNFCSVEFADRQEQVRHYKSDFHRFNVKQRVKGAPPITEECFEDIADDISSSLSGSDSSDDEDSQTETDQDARSSSAPVDASDGPAASTEETVVSSGRTPLVYFKNNDGELVSMYRCVLHGKKNVPETDNELISLAETSMENPYWAVLMIAAGHFAAAIFNRDEILEHKTFHRYTVRAKRGTAQGLRDSQGNAPKSGGASLRRHNEAALIQEVQELLQSWSEQLKKCSAIFLRAPSYNRAIFFGHKNPPFDKNDTRIRMIPFATRRPTFNEVKRAHGVLSSVMNYGPAEEVDMNLLKTPTKQKRAPPPKKRSSVDIFIQQTTKSSENASPGAERESTDEEEGEFDLRMVKEILTTIDLKMFEMTRKPKKKNKKKKKKERMEEGIDGFDEAGEMRKHGDEADGVKQDGVLVGASIEAVESELDHIQNGLYTASRTGNGRSLKDFLQQLRSYVEKTEDNCTTSVETKSLETDIRTNSSDNVTIATSDAASTIREAESIPQCNLESELCQNGATFLAVLNRTFGGKSETLLHVSSRTGQAGVIGLLLEAGADPCVKNGNKLPPYAIATSKEVRNAYRRFMAKFPDQHDYTEAQVPSPLTEDMENERKAKEAERKKAAKKAKQERFKDVRAKEAEKQKEEREQKRFLNLSEREKRALAADRRLVKQVEETSGARPVLSRCWQCGIDITALTPFEYCDYKFCTTKCLRAHRTANQEKKS